jgi:hypothetical protein
MENMKREERPADGFLEGGCGREEGENSEEVI